MNDKYGSSDQKVTAPLSKSGKSTGADRDVGAALRTVYQKTVEEKVPDEFLDLLGKLG